METLQTLVEAAQHGDLHAFSTVIQQFQGMAYATAYRMLGDVHLAEDATQEAFIEAYLGLPSLREPIAFPAWLRRIVLRQGERLIRNRHNAMTISLEACPTPEVIRDDFNPALLTEHYEQQRIVRQAIDDLSAPQRDVVLLFYGNGYALKEIAIMLDIPLSTVKKRLFDGRKHLKQHLMGLVQNTLREQQQLYGTQFPVRVQLLIAIRLGDYERVKALVQRDSALVITTHWSSQDAAIRSVTIGHTALHEAASYGQVECAELLLARGANVDAQNSSGLTPLHEAVLNRQVKMANLLLAHKASVDSATSAGLTPLLQAVIVQDSTLVVSLLSYHADVNARCKAGRTALHWAALKRANEIARVLLEHGAMTELRDELGRTPLDWARARGHDEMVALLQKRQQCSLTFESGKQ
jgi:RNA polymerase sigma factor (sigma-70 family)